jgi:hypothetical protein
LYVLLLAGAFLSSTVYGVGGKQITIRGSFLKYRANSAGELVSILRNDPTVCVYYAKHFGTTMTGVLDYFDSHLRLMRLRKSMTTDVYCLRPGKILSHKRVLPAGTLVFASESGQPVLDWRCGNPLTSVLPGPKATRTGRAPTKQTNSKTKIASGKSSTQAATTAVATATAPGNVVEKVLALPPAELTPTVATSVAAIPQYATPAITVVGAVPPPLVEAAVIPTVTAVGTAPVIAGFSRLASLRWLLPLAAGGMAIAGRQGNTPEPSGPEQPVPEPGSLVLLGSGFMTTCAAAIRARRAHRN